MLLFLQIVSEVGITILAFQITFDERYFVEPRKGLLDRLFGDR